MKVLIHAVIIVAVLNIMDRCNLGPGFQVVLEWLRPGAFTLFSICASAALNDQRAIGLAALGIALLTMYPVDMVTLSRLLVPVGAGIVAGVAARNAVLDRRGDPGGDA